MNHHGYLHDVVGVIRATVEDGAVGHRRSLEHLQLVFPYGSLGFVLWRRRRSGFGFLFFFFLFLFFFFYEDFLDISVFIDLFLFEDFNLGFLGHVFLKNLKKSFFFVKDKKIN